MGKSKKHFRHSHKSSTDVKWMMNRIAQESRMAERSAETAAAVLCLYNTMMVFGFKQKRLTDLASEISVVLNQIWDGELDYNDILNEVRTKVKGEYIDTSVYTPDQITKKKGSYGWYIDYIQLGPQNRINTTAIQYQMVCIYCLTKRGYGLQRIEKWADNLDTIIKDYQVNKQTIAQWREALLDNGVWVENPIDPMTGNNFSVMTGVGM